MKPNSNHTPGPWQLNIDTYSVQSQHPDYQNSLIAKIATGENFAEEKANARLIAAAPELLEALEHMVTVFNVKTIDEMAAFISIEKARAAIAKATGKE